MKKIDYEQSYEISKNMSMLELIQKTKGSGLFDILESEAPSHSPIQIQAYEKLLKLCDDIAKKIGGKIQAISNNDIREISLSLPFFEFSINKNDEYKLLKCLIEQARFVSFTPTDNNQIVLTIMI